MSLENNPADRQVTNEHDAIPSSTNGGGVENDKDQSIDENQMINILAVGETAIDLVGGIAHETIEETEQMAHSIVRWLDEQSKKYL